MNVVISEGLLGRFWNSVLLMRGTLGLSKIQFIKHRQQVWGLGADRLWVESYIAKAKQPISQASVSSCVEQVYSPLLYRLLLWLMMWQMHCQYVLVGVQKLVAIISINIDNGSGYESFVDAIILVPLKQSLLLVFEVLSYRVYLFWKGWGVPVTGREGSL